MRRSFVVLAMTIVFVLAMASAALAGPPGHGESKYGLGIQAHCGAPYGQLVKQAVLGDYHDGPFAGAKAFITNTEVAEAHGCVFSS